MSQVSIYLNQILEGLWGTALSLQLCNVKFVPVLIENIFVLPSFLPVKTPRHFLQAEGAVIWGDSDGSQKWCGELTSRLETSRVPKPIVSLEIFRTKSVCLSHSLFLFHGGIDRTRFA